MWTAIAAFLQGIAAALGLARDRSKLRNSAAMQANAEAKTEQRIKDQAAGTSNADVKLVKETAIAKVPVINSPKTDERRPLSQAERDDIAAQFVANGGLDKTRKEVAE